jgi:enamine deaminase RidA (YjgF/YER057c/UK114 family)
MDRHNTSDRQNISSASPYEPIIGFSRAVRLGHHVFVSGTAPIGPDGQTIGVGDAYIQARRCLEIVEAALLQAGARMSDVVRTRIFLVDASLWEQVGRAHGDYFSAIRPASTFVQVVRLLNAEWLVEIEADAVVGETNEP